MPRSLHLLRSQHCDLDLFKQQPDNWATGAKEEGTRSVRACCNQTQINGTALRRAVTIQFLVLLNQKLHEAKIHRLPVHSNMHSPLQRVCIHMRLLEN